MKLMIQWEIHVDSRHDVFSMWSEMDLEEYGAMQGSTIKTIGRWHDLINGRGVMIAETDDAEAMTKWLLGWNGVCDFDITIVHDDEEAHALVKENVAES